MKRIFVTIKEECRLLWKSVVLLLLILTSLLSVLFGMLSITISIPNKLSQKLSQEVSYVYCQAINAQLQNLDTLSEEVDYIFLKASGYTYKTFIKNHQGDVFYTEECIKNNNNITINNYFGCAFNIENEIKDIIEMLSESDQLKTEKREDIWLSQFIADKLNVKAGDYVYLGQEQIKFFVKGVYNEKLNSLTNGVELNYFYIDIKSIKDQNLDDYEIYVFVNKTTNLYIIYNKLKSKDIILDLDKDLLNYLSGIQAMFVIFILVSIILLISIVIILHNLFNIILAKRKKFICMLKMLGAKDGYIDFVYTTVILCLLSLAFIIAVCFTFIFNKYTNGLCFELFNMQFNSVLKPYIPLSIYAVFSLSISLQFVITNRKLNTKTVMQEIRRAQQ